jgi:hypothetical protein
MTNSNREVFLMVRDALLAALERNAPIESVTVPRATGGVFVAGEVCQHGGLARSCHVCELEAEVRALESALTVERCTRKDAETARDKLDASCTKYVTERDLAREKLATVNARFYQVEADRYALQRMLEALTAPPAATEASAEPAPTDCRYLPRWDVTCNRGTQGCGLVHDEPKP